MSTRVAFDNGFCRVEILDTLVGERMRVVCTDSVNILVYDKSRDCVLLVRQPKAGAISRSNPRGMITETVAGRFDVSLGPRALAVKEAREEAGVEIREDQVELLNDGKPMYLSAGLFTERAYLAYVEVDSSNVEQTERVFGIVGEGERIRRIWVPVRDLESLVCEDARVFALVQWFLRNKV